MGEHLRRGRQVRTYMSHPYSSHLRPHRKRSAFTQSEIAFLLGHALASSVSRYETGTREPDLRTAFAYQIIFDADARELFATVYQEVINAVSERAAELAKRTAAGRLDTRAQFKIERLRALMARAGDPASNI